MSLDCSLLIIYQPFAVYTLSDALIQLRTASERVTQVSLALRNGIASVKMLFGIEPILLEKSLQMVCSSNVNCPIKLFY